MHLKLRLLVSLFLWMPIGISINSNSFAQENSDEIDELAAKASKILHHDVGTWDCEWNYLDAEGNVTQSVVGIERMTFALDDKLVEMVTEIPAGKVVSKSMRFFNPVTRKITVLSVGADGNHWELNQEVGSGVMISKPHPNADGSHTTIRFTVVEQNDDTMEVLMEQSGDEKTWTRVFTQSMKRRKD